MATKANLTKTAKELNELFGLDPAIDVKAKPEVLTEKIQEATIWLEKDDDLSSAALAVLKELDWEIYLVDLEEEEHDKLEAILRDRGIWVNEEPEEDGGEGDEEDEKPKAKKEKADKPKAERKETSDKPKKEKSPSQTGTIRELIGKKKKRDAIVTALEEIFEKTAGWAEARMKIYEKAYGEMGENDPKL